MRFIKFVLSVLLVSFYSSVVVLPVQAFPHIQEQSALKGYAPDYLIEVKGGKISKGAGVASKIPGFEIIGTAKYIYGILATVIGALMFAAFKYVGNLEDKKYLAEREKERSLSRANGSNGRAQQNTAGSGVDGKRPLVEKPGPLFGK